MHPMTALFLANELAQLGRRQPRSSEQSAC